MQDDRDDVMQIAEDLARDVRSNRDAGDKKARRERVLAHMVATNQKELLLEDVKFAVLEKPEPVKSAVVWSETLRRHYGFRQPQLDKLADLVAKTKTDLLAQNQSRPKLSVKNIKKSKSNKSNSNKSNQSDDKEQFALPKFNARDLRQHSTSVPTHHSNSMNENTDLYEQPMNTSYVENNQTPPDAAANLLLGPLPNIIQHITHQKS